MKIIQINAVAYGSTGNIMFSLADKAESYGYEVLCTSGFTWKKCYRDDFFITSNIFEKFFHTYASKCTGHIGCYSRRATKKLIKIMNKIKPSIIHLHNIHGWFLNIPMLFDYIKKNNIRVIWTLHDCWAFTGHCPHFTMIKCDKWLYGCNNCEQHKNYPATYKDHSNEMFALKKEWFCGVKDLTIVTPSNWLANLVKQSFLKEYPTIVINNGIDLSVFKPVDSNFRQKYNILDKYIVLGVSYSWDKKKGLDAVIELSRKLDKRFMIVLVGTDKYIDNILPSNVLSIHRTQSKQELVEIYSAADVFINPTKEDNFPTVNIEALACSTPVITFKTGGSPEIVDENCGCVIPYDDIDEMCAKIIEVCINNKFKPLDCISRAKKYDQSIFLEKYMDLYGKKQRLYE